MGTDSNQAQTILCLVSGSRQGWERRLPVVPPAFTVGSVHIRETAMFRLAHPLLALGALLLAVGCSSREQQARELIQRRRLLEIVRASPTTAMVLGQADEDAFVKACVRTIAKGLTPEELDDALRFARSELGAKEALFQEQIIQTSLVGKFPAESELDPARVNLARELVAADPLADTVAERVRDGIVRSAAATFTEDELTRLLARARDPLAVSVQRKWPIIVGQAFQDVIKAAPPKPDPLPSAAD